MPRFIETPVLGATKEIDAAATGRLVYRRVAFAPGGYFAGLFAACLFRCVTRRTNPDEYQYEGNPLAPSLRALRHGFTVGRFVPFPWRLLLYDVREVAGSVRRAVFTL